MLLAADAGTAVPAAMPTATAAMPTGVTSFRIFTLTPPVSDASGPDVTSPFQCETAIWRRQASGSALGTRDPGDRPADFSPRGIACDFSVIAAPSDVELI